MSNIPENAACPECGGKKIYYKSTTELKDETEFKFHCQTCQSDFVLKVYNPKSLGDYIMTLEDGQGKQYIEIYRKDKTINLRVHGEYDDGNTVENRLPKLYIKDENGMPYMYVNSLSWANDTDGITFPISRIKLNDALKEEAMKVSALNAAYDDRKEKFSFYKNNNRAMLTDTINWIKEKVGETSAEEQTEHKKGCYIATAVYGSYDCPEVWTLRRFRDYDLQATWYGRAFIRVYYALSPSLVKLFGNRKAFNLIWKRRLDRLVKKLRDKGYESTPYKE